MDDGFQFVAIQMVNPSIMIDIRYATSKNFTHQILYPNAKCFLRKNVAEKLNRIQIRLQNKGLGLKVFDGYRPLSVQKKMWELAPNSLYVASPSIGSKHNRGAAVDLTLVDREGKELLMPTPFDEFSVKAHRDCLDLPKTAIENRQCLEFYMQEEDFIPLPTEWWHFDDIEWEKYPIEDLGFDQIGT